ncbi:MAG: hypothetical protein RJA98_3560 [Pseudomonadota bacterium]
MSGSQFLQAFWRWLGFGRVWLAGQTPGGQHSATLTFDVAFQIGQGAAHADEVVHQDEICPGLDGPRKLGLPG